MSNNRPTSIGYVMRSYPVLYQNTVHNEMRVLKALGHPIRVFSILEADETEQSGGRQGQDLDLRFCWNVRAPTKEVLRSNLLTLSRVGPAAYLRSFQLARRGGLLTSPRAFTRLVHWANEMKEAGVDHLHAHWATEATTVAVIFAWLTRLPFSFTAHAYDIFRSPQFFELKLHHAKFVVTVSEYNRRYIIEHFGPHHEAKVHVIYPLIDLSQFALRSGAGDSKLNIVSIARLTEYKGLIHLVEACRVLRDRGVSFVCQIVGQGEDQPLLVERIERNGLGESVKLVGAVPHHDIPSMLESATVFALPCIIASNGDRDGMPLVLIEAMARGIPVVSSNLIGLPELVHDGAGLLVPPGDAIALADALQSIGAMPASERKAMGRAGRRIVEAFDATKGTRRLLELITDSYAGRAERGTQRRRTERDVVGAF